jgi:hypothetical protein
MGLPTNKDLILYTNGYSNNDVTIKGSGATKLIIDGTAAGDAAALSTEYTNLGQLLNHSFTPDFSGLKINGTTINFSKAASSITTVTTNFGNNLSSSDTTVQKALDTLDDLIISSGITNLAVGTKTSTTIVITSDTGTDATIPAATSSDAGLLSSSRYNNITTNNAKVSFDSTASTKVGYLTVTQAVNLDTIESNVASNNAKVSFDSTASTKVGYLTVTQAVNLDTIESNVASNNSKVSYPGSASATELNILDGAVITTTELNYLDGVTSNVQTQLNSKGVGNVTKVGTPANNQVGIWTGNGSIEGTSNFT